MNKQYPTQQKTTVICNILSGNIFFLLITIETMPFNSQFIPNIFINPSDRLIIVYPQLSPGDETSTPDDIYTI